jgi:ribonuclease HI
MTEPTSRQRSIGSKFELVFDGGSRGNPGPAYGSYRIKQGSSGARKPVRLDLGRGTNNEAEYRTLIMAFKNLIDELNRDGIDPGQVELKVCGDSQLVIRQLQGQWKAKDARMRAMRDEVWNLAETLGSVKYVHQPRWRSVAALGH